MAGPGLITRQDLLQWADTIPARSELPRLLRRLILETGRGVVQPGFPAGEGVAAGGWDGTLVAADATPYIPAGLSVWELSVEKSVESKANKDYDKRATTPDGSPAQNCTYVAAVLRPWTKRQAWATARTAEGKWKGVRALGVDDIEAWLESAPVTHAWISQVLGRNPYGLRPVDLWWNAWAAATTPPMTPALVLTRRTKQNEDTKPHKDLIERLKGPGQVTTIKGGSLEEIQSFIAATLLDLAATGEDGPLVRAAFVDDVAAFRALLAQSNPLILIPTTEQTRTEPFPASSHHIVVPLSDAASADIELPPIDPTAAATALKDSGVEDQKADALGRLARRSLLTMRRELANKPELHQAPWAKAPIERYIRGLLLAGRWNEVSEGDKEVLAELSGHSYEDLRELAVKLEAQADPFVGRVDTAWTLVSAYDAWSQLALRIQPDDLGRLSPIVLKVLCEVDPALEIPKDERWWQASLAGKTFKYSPELRKGIASTLALLGEHGERVDAGSATNGVDWASSAVRRVFEAANADTSCKLWISLSGLLPLLAEAAPDAFLAGVQKGLEGESPLLARLFEDETSDGSPFGGSSPHTGLLWALENAIWSNSHFGRAVDLLARLAEMDPGGKLSNRPAASLAAVFNPWHPENSVDVVRRMSVIDGLRKRHPAVAWQLMLTMLPKMRDVHFPTHEPTFRSWKPAKVTVTYAEYFKIVTELIARLVKDAGSTPTRWIALIEHISDLPQRDRDVVLASLAQCVKDDFPEEGKPKIWESLRSLTAKHREYSHASWALPEEELQKIDQVKDTVQPDKPMERHAWLFQSHMPELPDVSIRADHRAYDAALEKHRRDAVSSIDTAGGFIALRRLAEEAEQAWWVGVAIADATADKYENELLAFLGSSDAVEAQLGASYATRRFVQGGWQWVEDVLSRHSELTPRQQGTLLVRTLDYPVAWERADEIGHEVAEEFWKQFQLYGLGGDFPHTAHTADRLIGVGRNAAALSLIELYAKRDGADTGRLLELAASALEELLSADDPEIAALGQYDFEQLFELFYDHRAALGLERVARLEWAYLPALGYDADPRMLSELLARDPNFFVELISIAFRPDSLDDTSEADDAPAATPEEQRRAMNAYRLLDNWSLTPGIQDEGRIDGVALGEWVSQAMRGLEEADRTSAGLRKIGNVLAGVSADPDGAWPSLIVRNLLEEYCSDQIDRGFYFAVVNGRGVTSRSLDAGGDQERSLAMKYRTDADNYSDQWPRTAAILRALSNSYAHDGRREDDSAERFRRGFDR